MWSELNQWRKSSGKYNNLYTYKIRVYNNDIILFQCSVMIDFNVMFESS